MKAILIYPTGTDRYTRRLYSGTEFTSLKQALQNQKNCGYADALLLYNGTVYTATEVGFAQASVDAR